MFDCTTNVELENLDVHGVLQFVDGADRHVRLHHQRRAREPGRARRAPVRGRRGPSCSTAPPTSSSRTWTCTACSSSWTARTVMFDCTTNVELENLDVHGVLQFV